MFRICKKFFYFWSIFLVFLVCSIFPSPSIYAAWESLISDQEAAIIKIADVVDANLLLNPQRLHGRLGNMQGLQFLYLVAGENVVLRHYLKKSGIESVPLFPNGVPIISRFGVLHILSFHEQFMLELQLALDKKYTMEISPDGASRGIYLKEDKNKKLLARLSNIYFYDFESFVLPLILYPDLFTKRIELIEHKLNFRCMSEFGSLREAFEVLNSMAIILSKDKIFRNGAKDFHLVYNDNNKVIRICEIMSFRKKVYYFVKVLLQPVRQSVNKLVAHEAVARFNVALKALYAMIVFHKNYNMWELLEVSGFSTEISEEELKLDWPTESLFATCLGVSPTNNQDKQNNSRLVNQGLPCISATTKSVNTSVFTTQGSKPVRKKGKLKKQKAVKTSSNMGRTKVWNVGINNGNETESSFQFDSGGDENESSSGNFTTREHPVSISQNRKDAPYKTHRYTTEEATQKNITTHETAGSLSSVLSEKLNKPGHSKGACATNGTDDEKVVSTNIFSIKQDNILEAERKEEGRGESDKIKPPHPLNYVEVASNFFSRTRAFRIKGGGDDTQNSVIKAENVESFSDVNDKKEFNYELNYGLGAIPKKPQVLKQAILEKTLPNDSTSEQVSDGRDETLEAGISQSLTKFDEHPDKLGATRDPLLYEASGDIDEPNDTIQIKEKKKEIQISESERQLPSTEDNNKNQTFSSSEKPQVSCVLENASNEDNKVVQQMNALISRRIKNKKTVFRRRPPLISFKVAEVIKNLARKRGNTCVKNRDKHLMSEINSEQYKMSEEQPYVDLMTKNAEDRLEDYTVKCKVQKINRCKISTDEGYYEDVECSLKDMEKSRYYVNKIKRFRNEIKRLIKREPGNCMASVSVLCTTLILSYYLAGNEFFSVPAFMNLILYINYYIHIPIDTIIPSALAILPMVAICELFIFSCHKKKSKKVKTFIRFVLSAANMMGGIAGRHKVFAGPIPRNRMDLKFSCAAVYYWSNTYNSECVANIPEYIWLFERKFDNEKEYTFNGRDYSSEESYPIRVDDFLTDADKQCFCNEFQGLMDQVNPYIQEYGPMAQFIKMKVFMPFSFTMKTLAFKNVIALDENIVKQTILYMLNSYRKGRTIQSFLAGGNYMEFGDSTGWSRISRPYVKISKIYKKIIDETGNKVIVTLPCFYNAEPNMEYTDIINKCLPTDLSYKNEECIKNIDYRPLVMPAAEGASMSCVGGRYLYEMIFQPISIKKYETGAGQIHIPENLDGLFMMGCTIRGNKHGGVLSTWVQLMHNNQELWKGMYRTYVELDPPDEFDI